MAAKMNKRSTTIRRVTAKNEESPSRYNNKKEGEDVDTTVFGFHRPAIEVPLPPIKDEMQAKFTRLLFM